MVLLELFILGALGSKVKLPQPIETMRNDLIVSVKQNTKEFISWI